MVNYSDDELVSMIEHKNLDQAPLIKELLSRFLDSISIEEHEKVVNESKDERDELEREIQRLRDEIYTTQEN